MGWPPYLQRILIQAERSVNPDSIASGDCYLPGGFVECDGFQYSLVVIVDSLDEDIRVGEDGEGISCDIGLRG